MDLRPFKMFPVHSSYKQLAFILLIEYSRAKKNTRKNLGLSKKHCVEKIVIKGLVDRLNTKHRANVRSAYLSRPILL